MEFSDLKYPYPVKSINLSNNISLALTDLGEGAEAIIFIHGLASYIPAWKKNLHELRNYFRCIAVDLPGYGKSSKDDYPVSMDFYADIIIELMDKLKIEKTTLAGHSMGGHISIFTALKYPERVAKLILISPAGFETFTDGESKFIKETSTVDVLVNNPVEQLGKNVRVNFYKMPKDAEFMIEDRIAIRGSVDFVPYCKTVIKSLHAMLDQPVFNRLQNIKQASLIFYGENDLLIPFKTIHKDLTTKIVAESGTIKIPNGKLFMIPECGHFLQFEKPDEFNSRVFDFLLNNN